MVIRAGGRARGNKVTAAGKQVFEQGGLDKAKRGEQVFDKKTATFSDRQIFSTES